MLLSSILLLSAFRLAKATLLEVKEANLRVDLSLFHNSSTNAVDFHISMASEFGPRGGWVALGTGHAMKGALMFIMYSLDGKGTSTNLDKIEEFHF